MLLFGIHNLKVNHRSFTETTPLANGIRLHGHELESPDEELTPEDRLSQVASQLAAAILRMRPPTPSICENPAVPSNSGLELVSESLLNVTRGELPPKRPKTRRIQK